LVLTRKINMKNKNEIKEATIYNNIESGFSLFISFVISTCVISTFAVYIQSDDFNNRPEDDRDLNLSSASEALAAVFGDKAKYIWALGLLAAG
jgi:Mn2+/Fe2+ NRAMP family transporter